MSTRSTWERQQIILFCLCVDQYYIGLQCIKQSFPGCLLTVRNYTKKWSKQFETRQHCDDDVSLCQMSLTTCYIPRTEGSNKQYAAISSSVCPSSVCPMPLIQNGAFKGCAYSLLQNANTGCRTQRSARPQRGRTATLWPKQARPPRDRPFCRHGHARCLVTTAMRTQYYCYYYYYYYTHARAFSGTTRISRYQKASRSSAIAE